MQTTEQNNNVSTKIQDRQIAETKVLTLGYLGMGTGRVKPFDQIFNAGKLVTAKDIKDGIAIDALVVWGGEDISPSLYGASPSSYTGARATLSHRDLCESTACLEAIERGIPIIGICRGAQLVCAMAGGSLIQHVNNHGITHLMETNDGRRIQTTSVHHQMMYPFDTEYEMLAWCSPKRSTTYVIEGDKQQDMEDKVEPEVVFFPRIKAIAIQGHPEFCSNPQDEFVQYCMEVTRKYLGV